MRQSGIAVTPSFEHLNACKATATQAVGGLFFSHPRSRCRPECWYRKTPSPLVRLVPIELVIGRKGPVEGGQALKRRLAPGFPGFDFDGAVLGGDHL